MPWTLFPTSPRGATRDIPLRTIPSGEGDDPTMIQNPVPVAGRGVMPTDVGLHGVNPDGAVDVDAEETREWLDSLESVLEDSGADRARRLLTELKHKAVTNGVEVPLTAQTPY